MFLDRFGVDMWTMYPKRFLALFEKLITFAMDEEQLAEWNEDMCSTVDDYDENDPAISDMIRMKLAATPAEAAELIKLGDRIYEANQAGHVDKAKRLKDRMIEINTHAKTV